MRRPALAAAVLGALLAAGPAAAQGGPVTAEELAAALQAAIATRDLPALERLINWTGASPYRKRIVSYELRHQFGRPIAEMRLEPFPSDGLDHLSPSGRLAANMPVSHRLKLIYDQPPMERFGIPPTAVFLLGQDGDVYKVALVVRSPPPRPD